MANIRPGSAIVSCPGCGELAWIRDRYPISGLEPGSMDIVVAAPGRAGGAIALAAAGAGHNIVALVSRSPVGSCLGHFPLLGYDDPLPLADLLVVAARDNAIGAVAAMLVDEAGPPAAAIHLSGYTPVGALQVLAEGGWEVGSFHPLQTLPTAELGAAALAGSAVAVTAAEPLRSRLWQLATDLGLVPFDLDDSSKPAYHAAATAASNYVVATLGIADELFAACGVPLQVARSLTEAVVANAYSLGPRAALTGPIARQDWDTVIGQVAAADAVSPVLGAAFRSLAEATGYVANVSLPESRDPGPGSK